MNWLAVKVWILAEAKAVAATLAVSASAICLALGVNAKWTALVTLVVVPVLVHATTNTPKGSLTTINPTPASVVPTVTVGPSVGEHGPETVVLPAGSQVTPPE